MRAGLTSTNPPSHSSLPKKQAAQATNPPGMLVFFIPPAKSKAMLRDLVLVDAFTKEPFAGNPCAVVLDADEISASQMQATATRLGLPETAFVLRGEHSTARVRYITPREELPMAGHPTLAVAHVLHERGRVSSGRTLTLEMSAGILPVELHEIDGATRYRAPR